VARPKWKPVEGAVGSQRLRVKHAEALVWKNGPDSWLLSVVSLAATEEEAKALAERLVREAKS
jgi:hypothetical protein